jgi:hypothetical protein
MPDFLRPRALRIAGRAGSVALPVLVGVLVGCAEDNYQEPRGGGYTETPPRNMAEEPEAKSALGKARQAAERLVNEDVAEYNRKLEEAADGVFDKKSAP